MPSNNFDKEIEKILNNRFKKDKNGNPSKPLSKKQIKTLNNYVDYYSNKKSSKGGMIKKSSVYNALQALRSFGLFLGKPYEEATKKDLINFFTKHLSGKSVATTSNWKVTIRSFYKWKYGVKKKHDFPEIVDDERLEPVRAPPRKISAGDLFTKDEVLRMIKVCRNPMDKSIVSIWFEMGIRASEFVSANIDSVEFISGGAKFYVEESKTEQGFVPLIQAAPYLQEWLEAHPHKGNPKAPLFIGLSKYYGNRLMPPAITQKLKRIAKRAGIKKRIFTHLGRNCSITNLDGTISIEDNARLHGITPSTILNVYTRRSRKEAVKKYMEKFGEKPSPKELAKEEKERNKLLPKICQNCNKSNPYDAHYCKKCLRPVDIETFLALDRKREIRDKIIVSTAEKKLSISKDTIKEILRDMIKAGEIEL